MSDLTDDDLTAIMGAFEQSGAVRFTLRAGNVRLTLAAPLALTVVTSPSVGHVEAVVPEGRDVAEGDVLARIRTLGNRFDVTAPLAGKLTKLTARDGDFVSYGALLAGIEAA